MIAFLTALLVCLSLSPANAAATACCALPPACLNFAVAGDSIALGSGVTPWPSLLSSALGTTTGNESHDAVGWNYSSSGVQGSNDLITFAPTEVDPLVTSLECSNGSQSYLVLAGGTNDIFWAGAGSGAAAFSSLLTYFLARVAAGWNTNNILVNTLLPRSGDAWADTQTYNNNVVSNAATYHYTVVRFDQDPNMGCQTCNTNLTYFQSDQVHPTLVGQAILANLVCSQMRIISSLCPAY